MVFTGIISQTLEVTYHEVTQQLHVPVLPENSSFWENITPGESVAVNGVCLTVLNEVVDEAVFFLQQETLDCTSFGLLTKENEKGKEGEKTTHRFVVNLERAMKSGNSYNGHVVLGHVHGVGKISSLTTNNDNSVEMVVTLPPCPSQLQEGLFRKGCITLDGVSLTLADVMRDDDQQTTNCRVSLIPYTLAHTTLHLRTKNDPLNVEFAPLILASLASPSNAPSSPPSSPSSPTLPQQEAWSFLTPSEDTWMSKAILLGEQGRTTSAPNPWVGCLIVAKDGVTLLGQGFHAKAGEEHAEALAIRDALHCAHPHLTHSFITEMLNDMRGSGGDASQFVHNSTLWDFLRESTLYVTLEPCHHTGRTPPCDTLLVGAGFKQVVVALLDPDERVSGQGVKYMQSKGLSVSVGVGSTQARRSLAPYLHHRMTGLPLCVLKVAQSMDGRVACADGSSRWITGPTARGHAHEVRANSQAIMVGVNTALIDKPQLTVRDVPKKYHPILNQPLRVVLDSRGRLVDGPLVEDAGTVATVVFTTAQCNKATRVVWEKASVEVIVVGEDEDGHVLLPEVLRVLGERGILQVLVEGGPRLQGAMILKVPHCIGILYSYIGGVMLGSSAIPWSSRVMAQTISESERFRWNPIDVKLLGNDVVVTYEPAPATKQRALESSQALMGSDPNIQFLSPMPTVIKAIAEGRMVLVMDDASRENEGDLVMAARFCGESHMALMIRHSSGIICAPMMEERAQELGLPLMVDANNTDKHRTAFTLSCDALLGSTGISASDRALTFRLLAQPGTKPDELSRPGHIFPLIARKGLLKERSGHTEASVALCRLAGIDPPVACISELTNDDGTMSRRNDVARFGREHGIPITTVAALKEHLGLLEGAPPVVDPLPTPCSIQPAELITECCLPIYRNGESFGEWRMAAFSANSAPNTLTNYSQDHVRIALIKGDISSGASNEGGDDEAICVRIHSACFTGDVLGSERCDCSAQLTLAMRHLNAIGRGVIMYERQQEGRGIGLVEKMKAYSLLEKRPDLDTYTVNSKLGHHRDLRSYRGDAEVLVALGIHKVRLMTTNPDKVSALENFGVKVVKMENASVSAPVTERNRRYLAAKAAAGHSICTIPSSSSSSSFSSPSSSSSPSPDSAKLASGPTSIFSSSTFSSFTFSSSTSTILEEESLPWSWWQ
mmetsp:Transcript_11865/g.18010  ORF Transcript_11865/g.18010 Transcript_11865/m.18010 type:complete len:1179 (-) Transcript_11865:265-3801(-)